MWDSERLPHLPASLGGGGRKLVPSPGELLSGVWSQEVRNGRGGETTWELLFPRPQKTPQDPHPRLGLLGDSDGELMEGEGAGVCKARVERHREPRGFSSTRLAWQQVQLQPRLLWDSSAQWSSVLNPARNALPSSCTAPIPEAHCLLKSDV